MTQNQLQGVEGIEKLLQLDDPAPPHAQEISDKQLNYSSARTLAKPGKDDCCRGLVDFTPKEREYASRASS